MLNNCRLAYINNTARQAIIGDEEEKLLPIAFMGHEVGAGTPCATHEGEVLTVADAARCLPSITDTARGHQLTIFAEGLLLTSNA